MAQRPSNRRGCGWTGFGIGSPAARLLLALTLLGAMGCVTTTRLGQFDAFATAGGRYAEAVSGLLQVSADLLVDTNSEKLIESRELAPVSREYFRAQDEAMRANLTEIGLLRRQMEILGQYFRALPNLATSDAPEAFAPQLESTVAALEGLSHELGRSELAKREEAVAHLAGGVGEMVVRRVQMQALEDELERRKETIASVLLLQESLLDALRAQVGADLEFARDRRYEREVEEPFLGAGPLPANWATKRRSLLAKPAMMQQMEQAGQAARKLRQAWIRLLSHKLTAENLTELAAEVEPILAGLEQLSAPAAGG